ncbi:hypothetical protein DFJ73DRAFT_785487 [Zopfochytrium polystomum]|nr:hypothetical protein DFJ73DRAFT_785487 [Zopfochytrium polystomum]
MGRPLLSSSSSSSSSSQSPLVAAPPHPPLRRPAHMARHAHSHHQQQQHQQQQQQHSPADTASLRPPPMARSPAARAAILSSLRSVATASVSSNPSAPANHLSGASSSSLASTGTTTTTTSTTTQHVPRPSAASQLRNRHRPSIFTRSRLPMLNLQGSLSDAPLPVSRSFMRTNNRIDLRSVAPSASPPPPPPPPLPATTADAIFSPLNTFFPLDSLHADLFSQASQDNEPPPTPRIENPPLPYRPPNSLRRRNPFYFDREARETARSTPGGGSGGGGGTLFAPPWDEWCPPWLNPPAYRAVSPELPDYIPPRPSTPTPPTTTARRRRLSEMLDGDPDPLHHPTLDRPHRRWRLDPTVHRSTAAGGDGGGADVPVPFIGIDVSLPIPSFASDFADTTTAAAVVRSPTGGSSSSSSEDDEDDSTDSTGLNPFRPHLLSPGRTSRHAPAGTAFFNSDPDYTRVPIGPVTFGTLLPDGSVPPSSSAAADELALAAAPPSSSSSSSFLDEEVDPIAATLRRLREIRESVRRVNERWGRIGRRMELGGTESGGEGLLRAEEDRAAPADPVQMGSLFDGPPVVEEEEDGEEEVGERAEGSRRRGPAAAAAVGGGTGSFFVFRMPTTAAVAVVGPTRAAELGGVANAPAASTPTASATSVASASAATAPAAASTSDNDAPNPPAVAASAASAAAAAPSVPAAASTNDVVPGCVQPL